MEQTVLPGPGNTTALQANLQLTVKGVHAGYPLYTGQHNIGCWQPNPKKHTQLNKANFYWNKHIHMFLKH